MESRRPAKNKRPGRPFEKGNRASPGRPKGSKNRPSTLNLDDAMMAVRLERKGHSASRIARLLDAKPEAVKDAIANGRKLLDQFNPEMARYWRIAAARAAKRGDHRPAMAAMQSTKAIEPIAQTYDTGAQGGKAVAAVKVELHGFTFAGLPQPAPAEPTTIDVTARSGT
jgi:hypothetical protein